MSFLAKLFGGKGKKKGKKDKWQEKQRSPVEQWDIIINNYANQNLLTDCCWISTRYNFDFGRFEAVGRHKMLHPHHLVPFTREEVDSIAIMLGQVTMLDLMVGPADFDMETGEPLSDDFLVLYPGTGPAIELMNMQFKAMKSDVQNERGKHKPPEFIIPYREKLVEAFEKGGLDDDDW